MSKDISQNLRILRSIIRGHIKLINLLSGILIDHPGSLIHRKEKASIPGTIKAILFPSLVALSSSCTTILKLSTVPGLQTRDCYGIARSIIELSINLSYILAEGPPLAKKAIRHAQQKMHRNLNRESKIGEQLISVLAGRKGDLSDELKLTEILKEFTSKKGREKDWTDLSIDQRIEAVGIAFGDNILGHFHFSKFLNYRYASEILHGTHFGACYTFGLFEPYSSNPLAAPGNEFGSKHIMVLMAITSAIFALEKSFHKKYGFEYLNRKSINLWAKINTSPWSKEDKTENPVVSINYI